MFITAMQRNAREGLIDWNKQNVFKWSSQNRIAPIWLFCNDWISLGFMKIILEVFEMCRVTAISMLHKTI